MADFAVEKEITAQNQFTDWIQITGSALLTIRDVSSMSMTVTLQCKQEGDTSAIDSDTETGEGAWVMQNCGGLYWRVGCKTGDYTSGTANVMISR